MYTRVHISVTKDCIVCNLADALWDLWNVTTLFEHEHKVPITNTFGRFASTVWFFMKSSIISKILMIRIL